MTSYLQMGHHSENLLGEHALSAYSGAILSPVNYDEGETLAQVARVARSGFETVFDPQLYYPNSERGKLPDWSYYPSDVDTADMSSWDWWRTVAQQVSDTANKLGVNALATPAIVPRSFTDDYYSLMLAVAQECAARLRSSTVVPVLTVLSRLDDLATAGRGDTIASIVTGGDIERVFLIFLTDVAPRNEIADVEGLKGGMRLIRSLREAGLGVTVGFSSSDVILWRHAGADSCATGKFFNLRRFTRSRFDPPAEGGGQLPYWFEEGLMAFLRESDVLRVQREGLLSPASVSNPYATDILKAIGSRPTASWLALSWRFYLYGFADLERRLSNGQATAAQVLRSADAIWRQLDTKDVLMEERRNDGAWVRAWRRAVTEM